MQTDQSLLLQKFKEGYGRLLGVAARALDIPSFTCVATRVRDQPEWANWVVPMWLFAYGSSLICSVSPQYAERAYAAFGELPADALLTEEMLAVARTVIDDRTANGNEWVQCELLFYPQQQPPAFVSSYQVEKLRPVDEQATRFLRGFDGGVYGIRMPNGEIAAHAGIKNKGIIHEIAVGTDEGYRRRGMGKAVVAHAVADSLQQGNVPVYWPDSLQNTASYALAYSLGFQKVAEMCFCCYELPHWQGFPLK